jgi:putative hydrolase of the HAD superfamily
MDRITPNGGPRGLIVDYGGVLTTSISQSFAAFCDEVGIASHLLREALLEAYRTSGDSPVHQMETGRITAEEFTHQLALGLAQHAGVDIPHQGLLERLFACVEPDERMLAAVAAVRKAGIRTALLSNSWGNRGYPRERFGELFDGVVISGEVGLRKPDPPIYRLAAERIGLPPDSCVFVDDIEENVTAAEAVGMSGIVHRRTQDTLARLAAILDVDEALVTRL